MVGRNLFTETIVPLYFVPVGDSNKQTDTDDNNFLR